MMEYYPLMAHQEVQLCVLVPNNLQDVIKQKQQGHEQNVLNGFSGMHFLQVYTYLYLMVNAYNVSGRVHNKPLTVVSLGGRVENEVQKETFTVKSY